MSPLDDDSDHVAPLPLSVPAIVASLCHKHVQEDHRAVAVSHVASQQYAGVVFASDVRARSIETIQETVGVGPGHVAMREGAPVMVDDLAEDPRARRWVGFVEPVVALGVVSIHTFPLQVGMTCVGLLTMHSSESHALDAAGVSRALRLSDAVMLALLTPALVPPLGGADGDGSAAMPGLLDGEHAVTHQAVGMVSVQLESSMVDALAAMRAHAFLTGESLVDVARQVVARVLKFRDSGGGGSRPVSHRPSGPEGDGDVDDR